MMRMGGWIGALAIEILIGLAGSAAYGATEADPFAAKPPGCTVYFVLRPCPDSKSPVRILLDAKPVADARVDGLAAGSRKIELVRGETSLWHGNLELDTECTRTMVFEPCAAGRVETSVFQGAPSGSLRTDWQNGRGLIAMSAPVRPPGAAEPAPVESIAAGESLVPPLILRDRSVPLATGVRWTNPDAGGTVGVSFETLLSEPVGRNMFAAGDPPWDFRMQDTGLYVPPGTYRLVATADRKRSTYRFTIRYVDRNGEPPSTPAIRHHATVTASYWIPVFALGGALVAGQSAGGNGSVRGPSIIPAKIPFVWVVAGGAALGAVVGVPFCLIKIRGRHLREAGERLKLEDVPEPERRSLSAELALEPGP